MLFFLKSLRDHATPLQFRSDMGPENSVLAADPLITKDSMVLGGNTIQRLKIFFKKIET